MWHVPHVGIYQQKFFYNNSITNDTEPITIAICYIHL